MNIFFVSKIFLSLGLLLLIIGAILTLLSPTQKELFDKLTNLRLPTPVSFNKEQLLNILNSNK